MKTIITSVLVLVLMTLHQLSAISQTHVKISTEFGDMIVELYDDTPLHRDNFIRNVQAGVYDNTLFHRIIPFFMMQGGDPNSIGAPRTQGLGTDTCPTLPAEIRPNRFHKKGALAAARLPDSMNPERNSSGCQFFIVHGYPHNDGQLAASGKYLTPAQKAWYKVRGGYPFLDNDYTVFGEVIEGLEVIDLICNIETSKEGAAKDRPLHDVPMTVTIYKK